MFRFTTAGESHGRALVAIVEGLAAGLKYDAHDLRNVLERASARETAARVACAALAKQLLASFGIALRSHVTQSGGMPDKPLELTLDEIGSTPDDSALPCADKAI